MVKKGEIINVVVSAYAPYGIFVTYNEYVGLIHISEISKRYVKDVSRYVKLGEIICVKVLDVDEASKHLKLSLKALYDGRENYAGNYLEKANGFAPLKEALPKWVEMTKKYYQNEESD